MEFPGVFIFGLECPRDVTQFCGTSRGRTLFCLELPGLKWKNKKFKEGRGGGVKKLSPQPPLVFFLEQPIPDVTVKDWKNASLSKHRELLDYFGKKIPMSSFNEFSEEPIFLKNIWNVDEEYEHGQWCYRFKFLEWITLHWLFHAGFGEIRFLKWCDVTIQIFGFCQY